jgi:hypothetical protein
MGIDDIDIRAARLRENYARRQEAVMPQKLCHDCHKPIVRNRKYCEDCAVIVERNRQIKRNATRNKPKIIKVVKEIGKPGDGVQPLSGNPLERMEIEKKIAIIVWAASQPGYTPKHCGKFLRENAEKIKKMALGGA